MDVKTHPRGTPIVALTTPAAGIQSLSPTRPKAERPKDTTDDATTEGPEAQDLEPQNLKPASPVAAGCGPDYLEPAAPRADRPKPKDPKPGRPKPATGAENPKSPLARLRATRPGALSSMSGRTVLLPDSALTTNGALAALLEVGARPLLVPLAEARPVGPTARLDQALTAMSEGRYGWLALSSAASVRMLDARARALFADDPQLSGLRSLTRAGRLRVASVGQATEAALAALGIRALVPERGSGPAALIGPLLCSVADAQVLFARGNLVGPSLTGALRGGGIAVDEVVTHITVREEDPPATATASWASGRVDAVLLTSPKAVRGMIDRLGPPRDQMIVGCMDEVTADVARTSGVRVDVVGPSPTVTSLVDALEDRFSA